MVFDIKKSTLGRPLELTEPQNLDGTTTPAINAACGRGAQITVQSGFFSVWFISRGCVQANIFGSNTVLCEGRLLISVDTPIKLVSIGDSHWLGLSIPIRTAGNLLTESFLSGMALQTYIDDMPDETRILVKNILNAISEMREIDEATCLKLTEQMLQLDEKAQVELANCPGRTDQLRRSSYQRLSRVKTYIATNPKNADKISDLAAMANYSESHFIRTFTKVFNETPVDYIHRLRMSYAKHLITDGRLSLLEISREVGFATFSAFCRSFRLKTGITPSAFRLQNKTLRSTFLHTQQSISAH